MVKVKTFCTREDILLQLYYFPLRWCLDFESIMLPTASAKRRKKSMSYNKRHESVTRTVFLIHSCPGVPKPRVHFPLLKRNQGHGGESEKKRSANKHEDKRRKEKLMDEEKQK